MSSPISISSNKMSFTGVSTSTYYNRLIKEAQTIKEAVLAMALLTTCAFPNSTWQWNVYIKAIQVYTAFAMGAACD